MSTVRPAQSTSGLTFGRILRSEFIKLFTVRSTFWCFAIVIVVSMGLSTLLAATFDAGGGGIPSEQQQASWVQLATIGSTFSQLVVAVLGVLVISGEYTTGMIRSTLTAVPRRLPMLVGKAVVIGVTTFIVGAIALVGAAILPIGLLSAAGIEPNPGDPSVWLALLGGAGYLGLLAVLSLAIGAIVRNSAGGIATALGLVLVLPTVLNIFAAVTQAAWAPNLSAFLPSSAGSRMSAFVGSAEEAIPGTVLLEPWQATLVLLAWVAVFFAVASILIKRRDA